MVEARVSSRAMCVWLGTLASYRPGLVGRLVLRYRTAARVLSRPPHEIAHCVARGARGDGGADGDGRAAGTASSGTERSRFDAALREGPVACLRRAERRPPGDQVVAWSDSLYPDQLRDLDDPPLCLFVRGGADRATVRARLSAIVDAPVVSVVGTRSPTPYGEEMARCIAGGLARAGVIVASGMALGIDAVAQTAAVEAGAPVSPSTVAVLGCGADVVYPRSNARLYARVTQTGIVVSEFAWGCPARAWRFPARNRVIAALARAVVLVEGAERSGARITAGHGLDVGREVLCVPGEAGRRLSQAPNRLLGHGASVCEGPMDVLEAIGFRAGALGGEDADGRAQAAGGAGDPLICLDHGAAAVRDVLDALAESPSTIDQLADRCGLTVAKAASAVSDLEVEGLARRLEGGRYRLARR